MKEDKMSTNILNEFTSIMEKYNISFIKDIFTPNSADDNYCRIVVDCDITENNIHVLNILCPLTIQCKPKIESEEEKLYVHGVPYINDLFYNENREFSLQKLNELLEGKSIRCHNKYFLGNGELITDTDDFVDIKLYRKI